MFTYKFYVDPPVKHDYFSSIELLYATKSPIFNTYMVTDIYRLLSKCQKLFGF